MEVAAAGPETSPSRREARDKWPHESWLPRAEAEADDGRQRYSRGHGIKQCAVLSPHTGLQNSAVSRVHLQVCTEPREDPQPLPSHWKSGSVSLGKARYLTTTVSALSTAWP